MDTQANNGILGQLGTINGSATVSVDNNTIYMLIGGIAFIVVLIICGVVVLRSIK